MERRPESARLLAVSGVGAATVGALMAVIGEPERFQRSRDAAAYLGLVPGQDQSGGHDPQMRITKTGDALVRRYLVQCAQSILSGRCKASGLQRWALRMAGDGKNAIRKKKAVVALARRLAVLLHRHWVSKEPYDPWRGMDGYAPQVEGATT